MAQIRRIARENAGRFGSREHDPATSYNAVRVATRLVPLVQHAPAARLGDRDKQVSWLCGSSLASPSRNLFQWPSMRAIPRTVAGAARASTRVPVLIPSWGNLSRAGKVPERARRVNHPPSAAHSLDLTPMVNGGTLCPHSGASRPATVGRRNGKPVRLQKRSNPALPPQR